MKKIFTGFLIIASAFIFESDLYSAVGCDLNDPDRDVRRLYPGSTGYKTHYVSIDKRGGAPLLLRIEQRLGDKFSGLYETIDVPYTVYEILRGKEKIGYIHGVNQKGKYGGIQVFLALDVNGVINNFYIQKVTSRKGGDFRSRSFGLQFIGIALNDFNAYDVQSGKTTRQGRVSGIRNSAPSEEDDFRAILRGAKKNLIIMDEFVFKK